MTTTETQAAKVNVRSKPRSPWLYVVLAAFLCSAVFVATQMTKPGQFARISVSDDGKLAAIEIPLPGSRIVVVDVESGAEKYELRATAKTEYKLPLLVGKGLVCSAQAAGSESAHLVFRSSDGRLQNITPPGTYYDVALAETDRGYIFARASRRWKSTLGIITWVRWDIYRVEDGATERLTTERFRRISLRAALIGEELFFCVYRRSREVLVRVSLSAPFTVEEVNDDCRAIVNAGGRLLGLRQEGKTLQIIEFAHPSLEVRSRVPIEFRTFDIDADGDGRLYLAPSMGGGRCELLRGDPTHTDWQPLGRYGPSPTTE